MTPLHAKVIYLVSQMSINYSQLQKGKLKKFLSLNFSKCDVHISVAPTGKYTVNKKKTSLLFEIDELRTSKILFYNLTTQLVLFCLVSM